jgi:hypothetical protein
MMRSRDAHVAMTDAGRRIIDASLFPAMQQTNGIVGASCDCLPFL